MVHVVSAAIVDKKARRVLLAQRSRTTSYPYAWCTPGGKVEEGETHVKALARELREEIRVELTGDLSAILYEREIVSTRTGAVVKVTCYAIPVEAIEGKPSPSDGTVGVGWFDVEALCIVSMPPADSAERERFLDLISERFATPVLIKV